MNFNRHRNIFTLGSHELSKRRPPGDLFEKDPFKIQSYNFRYADRPTFPMVLLQRRPTNHDSYKDCQTYFYNYDFPSTNHLNTVRDASFHNDKRAQNLTKFQQYRRRTFLNDTGSNRNSQLIGNQENNSKLNQNSQTSKILNSYDNKIKYKTSQDSLRKNNNQSSTLAQMASSKSSLIKIKSRASIRDAIKTVTPKHSLTSQPFSSINHSTNFNSAGISISPGRGSGSGCEININFKNLENSSQHENVNIKIKTDSVCKNLNIPRKHSNEPDHRVDQANSSASFVIDKRLSKFSSIQGRQSSRAKELTSIYNSEKFTKPSKADRLKSFERLPSLIPFKSSESKRNLTSSITKENFGSKKSSLVPSAKNNLSFIHTKAKEKSCTHNNLNHSSYLGNGGTKLSESNSLTSKQHLLNKLANAQRPAMVSSMHSLTSSSSLRIDPKSTAPLRLRNHARLPFNVNINVFADKLKLLKI